MLWKGPLGTMSNREIRVLHIGASSNQGGIESMLKAWVSHKPEHIHFDFINVENLPLAYEDFLRENGCEIYRITARKDNYFKSNKELKQIIRRGHYDYVHHHIMSLSWMNPTIIASKTKGLKAILHSHSTINRNSLDFKHKCLHQYGQMRLHGTSCLKLACGEDAGLTLFGNDDFKVIRNGIDLGQFRYQGHHRDEIRAMYHVGENDVLVGHIGRPGPQKNYPYLIETFSILHQSVPDTKLMLVGNILGDSEIEGLIEKYQLQDSVIRPGMVKDAYKYYSAMDVFFMPSLYEGVSVAMIEAQAAGLPCVVSRNVSPEVKVSERMRFVNIDNPMETARILKESYLLKSDRTSVVIDSRFDIVSSSAEIYKFYEDHL